jgi:heme/copper-type cytochrome/quinol oxidase subunit 1
LTRRKCPACKVPLLRWYLLIIFLLLVVCFGGLAVAGKLPWVA